MPPSPDQALSALLESPWIHGPLAFVLWIAVLFLLKWIVLGAMRRVAARTRWSWDDVLVQALRTPLTLAIIATGLILLERILPLSPEWDRGFDVVLAAAIALALVLFVDRICHGILDRLSAASVVLQGTRGLIQGIVRGLIIGLGLLIFLDSIGISITPLLASLGVGSLAVALALQDTLANIFAGIYMVIDKPIEAGHHVRLETGDEGAVTRVGWRNTWIRMLNNNVVLVPNTRLAGSLITNYSLPDREMAILVNLTVRYDSDLEKVERVTLEVAREIQRTVEGAVPDFEPLVRFHTFGESGVQLTVILRAREFPVQFLPKHEFIKRLLARYRREGIVIPFPVRTIDLPPGGLSALARDAGGGPPAGFRPAGG